MHSSHLWHWHGTSIQKSSWLKTSKWLDQLKLRLSYGSNGNQAISAYQTLDRLSAVKKYLFGDEATPVNGVYLPTNGVGNPNLKWETTNTFNAGLDYSFLNGRLLGYSTSTYPTPRTC